ncbi:ras guanine nucleotide exchange factor a [Anaeramoeba flamelloides]|uniref:Ras guanine nucleotide exchange factor a n=1 Tax=Anaeramoeba flamelloides TaxID=1746091 RepID=A0ABQ8YGX2_9EUKA|nr:ras guanine nucleotide exchange factor a [Anaeramoeba flamelloides]
MSQKSKLKIGDRVKVQENVGFIKYIGKTKLSEKAKMYGIEFEKEVGENDGSIDSTRYFEGKSKSCVFVKRKKVKLLPNLDTPISASSGSETNEKQSSSSSSTQESPDTNNESDKDKGKEKEKEKDKEDEDEEGNKDEEDQEMKLLKQIEELLIDKDESVILEELERLNREIDLLAVERSSSMNKITLFEKSIEDYSSIKIKENEEEQQNQEIEKLEKEIEMVLSSIHQKNQEEIENQKKISQLKVDIENLGNNELSDKVEQKKEQVIKLTREFEELKEQNQKTEEETTTIRTKIESTRNSHQNEIDDYKKKIDLMDDEILKDEERKKNFGQDIINKKSTKDLELKIEQLERNLKITKKRIFDLELGKNEHLIRMESVLEYRDNINRSNWRHRVMKKNPEIMDLRERINPLSRAISFAKYYSGAKVQVNELLTKKIINQLIMQHFEFERKQSIREKIEEVLSIPYHDVQLRDSRLRTLLRISLREIENLWDLLMTDTSRFGPTKEDRKILLESKIDELGLDMVADEKDVNIWDEPEDNLKNVIYDNGVDPKKIDKSARLLDILHCANVNKLVEKLTNDQTEVRFRDAFIMTYQSFMKPEQLLNKLKQRYNVPPKKTNENKREWIKERNTIQVRVVSVLKSWIKSGWADIDEKLLYKLVDFIKTTILPEKKMAGSGLIKLINDMKASKETSGFLTLTEQPPEVIVPKNLFRTDFTLLDVDEEEFARQFTLMVSELFRKIKPSELVTEAWQKKGLRAKATNVLTLINKFNEFSKHIATVIVQTENVKKRAKMYARFLKIGKSFLEMNNYDSLMSTIAGYTNSAVKRLKLTIAEVPKATAKLLLEYKSILKHDQGYKEYRFRLDKTEPPLVPYLGVFLTDITFISSGSPSTIDGLINFSKRKLLYNVVNKIQEYQRVPYKFHYVHQIQVLLRKELPGKGDKELYRESLKREPRK